MEVFAKKNGLVLELPSKQNYYPDLTFRDSDGNLLQWTLSQVIMKGKRHMVVGILYEQRKCLGSEKTFYSISQLEKILWYGRAKL